MTVSLDPRIGSELAGYRIEGLLGRGGMGVVYLARDLHLERRVALKLVVPELASDPRFRERFLRESRLAASLDHSHVVPVYEAGEAGGQLFLAMRYVEGTDLRSLLAREGPLEPARAVGFCSQVAGALDAAHVRGLVHRDVKPANVLVTDEGGREHCYLSDFGLARSAGGEAYRAESSSLSGTVDYTAPEQIMREPADGRADVYSLACVLYECLAGEPPFARPRPTATLFAHVNEPAPSLRERRPELPDEIDAVIARALAKDPEERYSRCGELCEAARRALGLEAPRRLSRRALLVTGGGALALAAAAAVPAILLTREERASPVLLQVDSLLRIDPATNEVAATIPVDENPSALAVGERAVWVAAYDESTLLRIDPEINAVSRVYELELRAPTDIAAGAGAVWLLHRVEENTTSGGGTPPLLRRLDLTTGAFSVVPSPRAGSGIAVSEGSVWIADLLAAEGQLVRVDEATLEAVVIAVPGVPWPGVPVVAGEESIWIETAVGLSGQVSAVDPSTNEVTETIELPFFATDIAVGAGALWATVQGEDSLLRIDLETKRTASVPVGRGPVSVDISDGSVWVANSGDGTLTRIDAASGEAVATTELQGTPTDVAVGLGAVWAAVEAR